MAGEVQQLADSTGPGIKQPQHLTRWTPGVQEPEEASQ